MCKTEQPEALSREPRADCFGRLGSPYGLEATYIEHNSTQQKNYVGSNSLSTYSVLVSLYSLSHFRGGGGKVSNYSRQQSRRVRLRHGESLVSGSLQALGLAVCCVSRRVAERRALKQSSQRDTVTRVLLHIEINIGNKHAMSHVARCTCIPQPFDIQLNTY